MHRVKVLGGHLGDISSPSIVVFCGGSGMHGLVGPLLASGMSIAFVLPVTDDGGSTAEIMRVLGGPAIGDVRNLLVRIAKEGPEQRDIHSIHAPQWNQPHRRACGIHVDCARNACVGEAFVAEVLVRHTGLSDRVPPCRRDHNV